MIQYCLMASAKVVIAPSVSEALRNRKGVVALESTIITHGMPYPKNFETAIAVEKVVRDNGAVPATIAVIDGVIRIGLSPAEIEHLAKNSASAVKISRRDIARVIAAGQTGSTTVAATMIFAHMANIPIFATGGIGGVHRGAESSFDISADITELARTPVLVVCAGAKSILDLPKTVELLETAGVPVIGFKTINFPAFFTPSTVENLQTSTKCDTEAQVAKVVQTHFQLKLGNGMLLTCPIPATADPSAAAAIEYATREAVDESVHRKILGKEITPFLLQKINEKTKGKSLDLNILLIKNNAAIAARVANELAALSGPPISVAPPTSKPITVIGGIIVDTIAKPDDPQLCGETRTSSPGKIRQSIGGVGRNIAQTILQLSPESVSFNALVGSSDPPSIPDLVVRNEAQLKKWNLFSVPNQSTGQYLAVMNGDGSLCSGIVDMPDLSDSPSVGQFLDNLTKLSKNSNLIIIDCNFSENFLSRFCNKIGPATHVWVDCVSVAKCVRVLPCLSSKSLKLVKANLDELCSLVGDMIPLLPEEEAIEEKLVNWVIQAVSRLREEQSASCDFLITCGKHGAFLVTATPPPSQKNESSITVQDHLGQPIECSRIPHPGFLLFRYTAPSIEKVVDCTGAGDSLFGATAWAHEVAHLSLEKSVLVGMVAARMTLMSEEAVAREIGSSKTGVIGKIARQLATTPTSSKL